MRSLADPEVPNDFREYLPFAPLKDTGGPVLAFNTDEQSVLKSKIEDLNDPPPVADSPEGVGRIVVLPAGRLTTGELELSQMQSLRGVKGSTILTLKSDATISNRGDDTGAYITIKDDLYVVHGIAGQGVIEDLDIDAIGTRDVASGPANIHGLYAPLRETEQDLHTIRNVAVYNAQTNGIHFDVKNNKLVCDRLRSENSLGVGIYLAGGDVKARALGSVATGAALTIVGAAVELDQFDLWRPDSGASGDIPTLDISGGPNGCVIKSGTVEGKTLFAGKNTSVESGKTRYVNSRAQFAFVHFKYDPNLSPVPDCYFEARNADLVELISCKFGYTGKYDDEITPYDYLIRITNTNDSAIDNGLVKISGGTGMLRFLGRDSESNNRMLIDARLHICDQPKLLLFDWGRMGTVEMVPPWAVDPLNPLRTHLRCDGTTYNSKDQPFAYLNVDAYYGTWTAQLIDDESFTMPDLPALSENSVPAIRAVP